MHDFCILCLQPKNVCMWYDTIESLDDKNKNNTSMSAEKYRQQLDLVKKKARSKDGKRSVEEYNASKRFDMLSTGDVEKLVKKRKTEDEPILYFAPNEEPVSKIQEMHVILLGIILAVIDGKYRIGTVVGCFDKLFSCSQVEMCAQKLLQEENVPNLVLGRSSCSCCRSFCWNMTGSDPLQLQNWLFCC